MENSPLPSGFDDFGGEDTGMILGGGVGWKRPGIAELSALQDGQVVAIAKGGVARQAKWDAASKMFVYENELSGKLKFEKGASMPSAMDFDQASNDIPGALTDETTAGSGKSTDFNQLSQQDKRAQFNEAMVMGKTGKKTQRMWVDPSQVDAIGVGEGELKTAGKTALQAAPSSLAGLYTFMRTADAFGPTKSLPHAALKYGTATVVSGLASAGVKGLQDASGILSSSEQDQINAMVNPGAASLGGHIPTLLAFRPSGSVLKAAAGIGDAEINGLTQKQALETIGKGGLMNLGIAQSGAMVDPIINGSPDPKVNRFQAAARTIGMGDPTKEMGGSMQDRLGNIGKELAIGGLLLHKPWGIGSALHNAAHLEPTDKVNFSGAPTFDAIKAQQARDLTAAAVKVASDARANQGVDAGQVAEAAKLTPEQQTGIVQIKAALAESLKRGIIDKETHDTANVVADTMGAEMLKHIQLRQVGSSQGGTELGSSRMVENSDGIFTAVNVFANAIKSGKFKHTLFHEISHPLFDSLSAEKQKHVMSDLVAEREAARRGNRALDYVLTKMGVKNTDVWDFSKLVISQREKLAIEHGMKSEGIEVPKSMFIPHNGGYKFSVNYVDGKPGKDFASTKRLYRLKDVREFLSEEAARIMSSRGEYDKKWGAIKDGDIVAFLRSAYHGMKKALQATKFGSQLIGSRSAVDVILDRIAEGNFKSITESGTGEIAKDALGRERELQTDENVKHTKIDEVARDLGIGELLANYNEAGAAADVSVGRDNYEEGVQRIRNTLREKGEDVQPSKIYLSEDDADADLPMESKAALKKLGLKNTVISNVVRHSSIGHIESSFDTVSNPHQAAHVFRNTATGTQESIQVLVTDKNGKPLEIYRHTLSEPGASQFSPLVLVSQALAVKGAKNIWMSHNHPSQTPTFSGSDHNAARAVDNALKGTGIKMAGFLAIAGDRAAIKDQNQVHSYGETMIDIPPAPVQGSGKRIPLIERRFTIPRGGPEDHLSTIRGDSEANQRKLVNDLLGNEPGIVFLDRNQMPVGTQKMSPDKMAKLGGEGARSILAAFSRSSAETVLLHVGGDTVPLDLRKASAENVANLFASVGRHAGVRPLRNVLSNDSSGNRIQGASGYDLIKDMSGDYNVNGPKTWKSEDDFSNEVGNAHPGERGGTRVGVGEIKPLQQAPKDQFPIPESSLKPFGITRATLDQFSEHAVVRHINTGVSEVNTAGDVASLMYDYSGTLAQGQTMLLVVGDNGEPIQVGLHMVDKSNSNRGQDVMQPMFGVLAGKAISTPGAREAWMVRINNDYVPGEADAALKNEKALKNLLEGTGINYRGVVTISGRKYMSNEYQPGIQNPGFMGHGKFDSQESGFKPIDILPKTGTVPLTERRYVTRSQVPFDPMVKMKDRVDPTDDKKWRDSEDSVRRHLNKVFGTEPGVLFTTSSGRTAGTVHLTLDEMANIRGSEAQKTLLAVMDRAGVNWGFVTVGDAPRTPETNKAVSNINAFLGEMGLKVIDTFHSSGTISGNPEHLANSEWKSEDDAVPDIQGGYSQLRSKTGIGVKPPKESMKLDPVEARVNGIQSLDFTIDDWVLDKHVLTARKKEKGMVSDHLKDFMDNGIYLGETRAEQIKNLRQILVMAIDSREGIARIGEGISGGYGARTDGSKGSYITVLSYHGNVPIKMIFDAQPGGNSLVTAYPLTVGGRYDPVSAIKNDPTYKPSKGNTAEIDFNRSQPLRKLQAKAGLQNPNEEIPGPKKGFFNPPPIGDPVKASDRDQGRGRGMFGKPSFSEDDASEANDRAERLLKPDSIVGPESIRGDFVGYVGAIKELANEHLFQHPFPGNNGDYEGDIARDKSRLAKHAIIDQVYAKLTKQKGFNPMTLKPGMLKALRAVEQEVVFMSFKELTRFATNVHEDSMSSDPAHDKDIFQQWKWVKNRHAEIIDMVSKSMQTGMTSKEAGMDIIDMANEIRSSTMMAFDGYRKRTGGDREHYSEDDSENMSIPGGARDEFLKRKPAKQIKTYLNIGHGDVEGEYGNAQLKGNFKPEDTFLYTYNHGNGKFNFRNIAEMAKEHGVEAKKADDFAHGMGGNLIENDLRLGRNDTGISGRIEIDHENQKILISAGTGRGKLDPEYTSKRELMSRRDALKEIRDNVERLQKEGNLPADYTVEGYGFARENMFKDNFQERFSENDDSSQNYEGLAFSEDDVRKWKSWTPEERSKFVGSLPDKKNVREYYIMLEHIRQVDFDNRPGAQERRARHEARRQSIIDKYKAQGHPYPELAADRELNPPPTGQDPEDALDQMRRDQSSGSQFNSEDDGENMRIPGGARDNFQKASAKVNRQKPIRFWTDIGHADRRDAEGEQNTYLWYATRKGEIQVISADELRHASSPEGYQLTDSDSIPTHAEWEDHLRAGNIEGDYGKQPIMELPHGRIDDRGDVTRISFLDTRRSPSEPDYEHNREEIKKKLAEYMGKKADEMPGYDFTTPRNEGGPTRFSEDDGENMRIPGGARDEAMKRKPVTPARVRMVYTDIGHPNGQYFQNSPGVEAARDTSSQYLWAYNQHGEFKMISVDDLYDQYNQLRAKRKYGKHGNLLTAAKRSDLTHYEWSQVTGDTWDHQGVGSGRVDELPSGAVRMSWAPGKGMEGDARMFKGEELKSEVAAFLNGSGNRASKVNPDAIHGYRWDYNNYGGQPGRFSEDDPNTYRDLANRPIGEGKDGASRLVKIARRLSEDDENQTNEPPFRIPKTGTSRTNLELARDIVTARFFTGISNKAHEIASEYPGSKAAMTVANMIHARAGAEAGVTGLDMPTSIMKERTRYMNRFFDIMDPLRGEFSSMSRADRETAYREFADMITGLTPIDTSTPAGRAAEGLKALLKEMHEYRTAAGEKLGEVEDYFPAVYDSFRIASDAMAFKDDAKRAYMIDLANEFQGAELEAAAEKKARELTLSHIRGEGEGEFKSFFEESTPALGENSSKSRKFSREAQEIMSKWQIKDPYRVISRYVSAATKRAEVVRRLGDEGQKWRKIASSLEDQGVSYEKIDELRELLKASVGIGRKPNTKGEQTYIDLMGLYTAGSVMGRSFLNNMFEPGSMGMRSGNLGLGLLAYGETWGRTLRNGARIMSGERIDKTFWEKYAEHIGTISADINDAWMNSHSIDVDGDRSDPRISWLTSRVYQANLLQATENAKLQASHAIGFRFLVNLAEMHRGESFMNKLNVTESVRSNLRELGVSDADHDAFSNWLVRVNKLDDAGRMKAMTADTKMAKLFEVAMTKFSMQSSVRAQRSHKPVFQDGPIGKTLFQLMSYSYSYAAEVNSRTYSYAKSSLSSAPAGKSYSVGDRIRFMAPLMMAPLGIIAYRAMFDLKDMMYPTEYSEKHKDDPKWIKWLNAASYASIFGPKVEMATKYVMRDQPPGGPAGQAVIGTARAAKTAVTNAVEGKPQDTAKRQAAKAAIQPIKAAAVIGATALHPAAGAIASQVANSTFWSNKMTEDEKKASDKNEGKNNPYEIVKRQK